MDVNESDQIESESESDHDFYLAYQQSQIKIAQLESQVKTKDMIYQNIIKQIWQRLPPRSDNQTTIKFDMTINDYDLSQMDQDQLTEYFI